MPRATRGKGIGSPGAQLAAARARMHHAAGARRTIFSHIRFAMKKALTAPAIPASVGHGGRGDGRAAIHCARLVPGPCRLALVAVGARRLGPRGATGRATVRLRAYPVRIPSAVRLHRTYSYILYTPDKSYTPTPPLRRKYTVQSPDTLIVIQSSLTHAHGPPIVPVHSTRASHRVCA